MDLDGVETGKRSFHSRESAAVGNHNTIKAHTTSDSGVQPAPIARLSRCDAAVTAGVECSAGAITTVQQRSEDNFSPVSSLGKQLGTDRRFDSGSIELDNNARINRQLRVCSSQEVFTLNISYRSAGRSRNDQVFAEDMGDIGIVKASRDGQSL